MNCHQLTRKLKSLGCVFDRQAKGDHEIWLNPKEGLRTTIPNWGSRDLKPGTISKIIRDLGIKKDELDKA